jgi:phosphate transport system substrate-binding protein
VTAAPRRLLCVTLAVLAACAAAPAKGGAQTMPPEISMSGSNTVVPLVADLVYYYRRTLRRPPHFTLRGVGTPTGVADVARGVTRIGLAARGPAAGDPPGLVFTPLAISGVCLVANVRNPVAGVTRAQWQDVVAGRRTTWAGVPGAAVDAPIVKAGLDPGLAGDELFRDVFVDAATPLAGFRTFPTFRALRAFVLATPAAAGYIDFAFLPGLHGVPYEGVPCSRATIASGAYPGRRQLSLVTRGGPSGAAGRFIAWARTSAVARRVIATRYVLAR